MKLFQFILCSSLVVITACTAQRRLASDTVTDNDKKKDVELVTTKGTIIIRLSDSTQLHHDNFLKLVKTVYYVSILVNRVIKNFMINVGEPNSKTSTAGQPLGNGGPGYTVPAEFIPTLIHKKGALAAARMGDNEKPKKESSGSQ